MEKNQKHEIIPAETDLKTIQYMRCSGCDWMSTSWVGDPDLSQEIAEHDALLVGGMLAELAQVTQQIRQANIYLAGRVVNARREGATWQQIGNLLGVSRQAAEQKYGKICR